MKKLILPILLLVSLSACKKEYVELEEYRVRAINFRQTFCEYTIVAPGKENIIVKDKCGKWKMNDVVLQVKK